MSENEQKAEVTRARVLRGALEVKPQRGVAPNALDGFTKDGRELLRRVLERAREANRGER